jgi:hypothetical protein
MDTIWKNAAKKVRAREERAASRITTAAVENPPPTVPITLPPTAFDPETGTLEELEQTSQRLQRDWPKEDGIPFPPDILETLRALRAAVIARDARNGLTAVQPLAQTAPVQSADTVTETALKKAAKKRRLREKRAAEHTTAWPTTVANPPAAIAIISNMPIAADCSSTQIGAVPTTTSPASELPRVSHDAYNTAHPERLYNLLATTTATLPCSAIDAMSTKPPEPADYSLEDIEEVLQKILKRHARTGTPVPESIQETAEALRRAVRARDTAVPTQVTTEPIDISKSDKADPTPNPILVPVPTPALPPPVETSTPAQARTPKSNPIAAFESDTAATAPSPSPSPTTTTDSSTTTTTEATTVVMAPTVECHRNRAQLEAGRLENGAEQEQKGPEEESTEREGNRREKENKQELEHRKGDTGEEIRIQIGKNDATRRQSTPFDWATDVDKSFGPAPILFDNCTPTAHVDTSVNPAPTVLVTPVLSTVHSPRDLSALCSGMKNPWSSIQRRHSHSRTPRNLSGPRSGVRNPWGSINHRRHRFHPPRDHHPISSLEQLRPLPDLHSRMHPQQGKPALRDPLSRPQSYSHWRLPEPPQLNLHSQPRSPAQLQLPVHIFQIIQHPHSISPTKPKITKIIPTTTAKIPKNTHTPCHACGNIIPMYRPDREHWRSIDTRVRRFRRRSRRFWIANEDVRYVWGGHL